MTSVDINIGTGSTSAEVVTGVINAGSYADFEILQSFFNVYNSTELFVSSDDWGSSIINIYLKFERVI